MYPKLLSPSILEILNKRAELIYLFFLGVETRSKNASSENSSTPATAKTTAAQPVATLYQPATQPYVRNYTEHSLYTPPVIPPNTAYMINGTPGTSNMRISLIPDEYAKHSNKERERRWVALHPVIITYIQHTPLPPYKLIIIYALPLLHTIGLSIFSKAF